VKLTWLDWLLLLTLSVLTFEKIRWETSLVTLTWTNLLATAFVVGLLMYATALPCAVTRV